MIVQIELPIHAHLAVHVADEEGDVLGILVHHGREWRTGGGGQAVQIANVVREKIVRHLGASLQVDGPLIVVPAFVRRTPVVHVRTAHVEGVSDAVHRVIGRAMRGRVGIAGIALHALDGEVRVVVIDGEDAFAAREERVGMGTPSRSHRLAESHQFLLPDREAVKPADALVDGTRPDGLISRRLEVEERLAAAYGEALMRGRLEQGLIVLVAVARDVVITVHSSALDVNLDGGPLAERLRHGLCVGRIYNIVEGVFLPVHDIQAASELLARLGCSHQIVPHTAGDVESGIIRYIGIHEDIERAEIGSPDARGIAHVRATSAQQFVVPVGGIAICRVLVNAEVLFVGRPRRVFQFHSYLGHVGGHASGSHGLREFLIRHTLVFGPQAGACRILKVGVAQRVHHGARILFHRVERLQPAHDGAVAGPAGLLVILERI